VNDITECTSSLSVEFYNSLELVNQCCDNCGGVIPFSALIEDNAPIKVKDLIGNEIATVTFTKAPGTNYYLVVSLPNSDLLTSNVCKQQFTSPVIDFSLMHNNVVIKDPVFTDPVYITFVSTLQMQDYDKWDHQEIQYIDEKTGKFEKLKDSQVIEKTKHDTFLITVITYHFTNFAVLLEGNGNGNGNSFHDIVISWLSLAFIIAAIIITIIAAITYDVVKRYKTWKSDEELNTLLKRASTSPQSSSSSSQSATMHS